MSPGGGGGGFTSDRFYTIVFPREWAERHHISRLEALNVIIAVRTLACDVTCSNSLLIKTDNSATAYVLLSGRTQDGVMGACARALATFAIERQIDIRVIHAPGETLILADALSRRSHDEAMDKKARSLTKELCLQEVSVDITQIFIDCDL